MSPAGPVSLGMYVRVPIDTGRDDHDFRDFRIGKVCHVDDVAGTVELSFEAHPNDPVATRDAYEWPLELAQRCQIAAGAKCEHISTGEVGELLASCADAPTPGAFYEYYARFGGNIVRVSEEDLLVRPTRQDPNPLEQLQRYELHNPAWRFGRDAIVEAYADLRNATLGVEELVGSRIQLLAHQAEVVSRVLSETRCRFILADEVGLGKTIEASVILKGLRRRHPGLETLIIVPGAVMRQWRNELDTKFWLDFPIMRADGTSRLAGRTGNISHPGLIIATEALAADDDLWAHIRRHQWGLLIADEAHHLRKHPSLYKRVCHLSRDAERALILSATPIQRRADEYLALLRLMDPARYDVLDAERFHRLVDAQAAIRRTTAYLVPDLTPERFVREDFVAEMRELPEELKTDSTLEGLVDSVQVAAATNQGLLAAREALAYISENYRIESRVIRNRRAHLEVSLPVRVLDQSYAYAPSPEEVEALDAVYNYAEAHIASAGENRLASEFCRILLHAAYSSPYALLDVLKWRDDVLDGKRSSPSQRHSDLAQPAAPRDEQDRMRRLIGAVGPIPNELRRLQAMQWRVSAWRAATDAALLTAAPGRGFEDRPTSHRLTEALRAIYRTLGEHGRRKVLVFSAWPQTLSAMMTSLVRCFGKDMTAEFRAGRDDEQLEEAADRFQASDRCYVLLCDELGGEGRNFQIASHIIHLDLPWTPAQVEQRIGRVDRLGRTGDVRSIALYAREQPEHDLFRIWDEAFRLFTQSMSGLEIALEEVQDDLTTALHTSVRQGLFDVLPQMIERADRLRAEVDEERYFEDSSVNLRQRTRFEKVSTRYRDGAVLRQAILPWARLAGLAPRSDDFGDVFRFSPRDFVEKSMLKAKYFAPPNMEEALRRSRHRRDYVIAGTFNRDQAVRREDLVFFAPGCDPWTDAIVQNALEEDRGRCCAVRRLAPELPATWQGFELLYSFAVDPRPLYAAGFDPSVLFRAQGYLRSATKRLLFTPGGKRIEPTSSIAAVVQRPWDQRQGDVHLGRRDAPRRLIDEFRKAYPTDQWRAAIGRVVAAAEAELDTELGLVQELADEALDEFSRRAAGGRAAARWLRAHGVDDGEAQATLDDYDRASAALADGIRRPLRRLESVCFWYLDAGKRR